MTKLVVVGLGYVGIPVACAFADKGFNVVGIDIVKDKVNSINKGVYPIGGKEPGMRALLKKVVRARRFRASMDFSDCGDADFIIISVETPLNPKTRKMDLKVLRSAVTSVGKNLSKGTLISVESTIAPFTTRDVIIPILERGSGLKAGRDFHLVHCPERVMTGRLLLNLRTYDRVIGGIDKRSSDKAKKFYRTVCKGALHTTDALTAELVKTTENAYRDVQIAFANEIALICEEYGIDAFEARKLVNTTPFRDMHIPGPGVGGHCLPKDPILLISKLKDYRSRIISNARALNDYMPLHVVKLVEDALRESKLKVANSTIILLGLSFLENSGDVRNSPAITIHRELRKRSAKVKVHDPHASYRGIKVVKSLEQAIKGADCVVIVTAHDEYTKLGL
ncbi:MAG: nucleotide sugar dehydrogenase, partial [Thermoplasmata archaeon]|nr:nucleotide sugar dehydrogenase [Thermoplasmata archaeon]